MPKGTMTRSLADAIALAIAHATNVVTPGAGANAAGHNTSPPGSVERQSNTATPKDDG